MKIIKLKQLTKIAAALAITVPAIGFAAPFDKYDSTKNYSFGAYLCYGSNTIQCIHSSITSSESGCKSNSYSNTSTYWKNFGDIGRCSNTPTPVPPKPTPPAPGTSYSIKLKQTTITTTDFDKSGIDVIFSENKMQKNNCGKNMILNTTTNQQLSLKYQSYQYNSNNNTCNNTYKLTSQLNSGIKPGNYTITGVFGPKDYSQKKTASLKIKPYLQAAPAHEEKNLKSFHNKYTVVFRTDAGQSLKDCPKITAQTTPKSDQNNTYSLEKTNQKYSDNACEYSYLLKFNSTPTNNTTIKVVATDIKNNNTATSTLTLYKNTPEDNANKLPKKSIVGYVSLDQGNMSATSDMITKAINNGYNVFVYAFANQDYNNTVTVNHPQLKDIKGSISDIHNNKDIALLSVGGQNGIKSFKPNLTTPDNIKTAADNMYQYLTYYNFDGLDFDLEAGIQCTADEIENYIKDIRLDYKNNKKNPPIITASPQINGRSDNARLAPTEIFTQVLLNTSKFDAIFLQTFNQYGGAIFNGVQGSYWEKYKGSYNGVPDFLKYSFLELINKNNAFQIPQDTKIIIGTPSFEDTSYLNGDGHGPRLCMSTGNCSGIGVYPAANVILGTKEIMNNTQFGGFMSWAINYDSKNNWQWVAGIKKRYKTSE